VRMISLMLLYLNYVGSLYSLGTLKWKNSWKLQDEIRMNLSGHAAVIIEKSIEYTEEQILIFGGLNGNSLNSKYINTLFHLDPRILLLTIEYLEIKRITYSPISSRRDHTLTYSPYDDKVYLIGGWECNTWFNSQILFSNIWSLNASMLRTNNRLGME